MKLNDEALKVVVDNFSQIKNQYGGEALAFIASSKGTNEESYLMQKLSRQVFDLITLITVQDIVRHQQQKVYLEQ